MKEIRCKPVDAPPVLSTVYDKAEHYMVEQYDGFWVEYSLWGKDEDIHWYPQEYPGGEEGCWARTMVKGIFKGFPWDEEE